jgi:hypothetical protein
MSLETLECRVEKVEIDLSEKGLTDLARMLVQSGRMSAPSFSNWSSRVSSQASRWARANRESSKAGKGSKPNKEGGSKTAPKDESKPGKPVSVKDANKLSGFKKAWPGVNINTWKGVLSASEALRRSWMVRHKEALGNSQNRREAAQAFLAQFGLNEAEMKQSRAWFPLLPGDDNKELYKSISIEAEIPQQEEDTSVARMPGAALKAGDEDAAGPSNAWAGGGLKLVMDQTGTTGTSPRQPFASSKWSKVGHKNGRAQSRKGGN